MPTNSCDSSGNGSCRHCSLLPRQSSICVCTNFHIFCCKTMFVTDQNRYFACHTQPPFQQQPADELLILLWNVILSHMCVSIVVDRGRHYRCCLLIECIHTIMHKAMVRISFTTIRLRKIWLIGFCLWFYQGFYILLRSYSIVVVADDGDEKTHW